MATIYAIKAMLLEEVLLNLLKDSGYKTVNDTKRDDTLNNGHSGIEVKGRGWNHQIDAIADFVISPPFSYPIRLLLEAKFYQKNIGIDIIRNAVGVRKDVEEFWVSNSTEKIAKPRYHYQYAIFTSSKFTFPAQQYAFAQDIYLIKLENNRYFLPVIEAIEALSYEDFKGESNKKIENINLSEFRKKFRKSLNERDESILTRYSTNKEFNQEKLNNIFNESISLNHSYLGMLSNRFPIFLTPSPTFNINTLIENDTIRICWDDEYWYIVKDTVSCRNLRDEDILFSFDLPEDIFKLYEENNMLSLKNAINLKEEFMSNIKIIFKNQNQSIFSSIELKLDRGWLEDIKSRLNS
jgi:hypothetical protein